MKKIDKIREYKDTYYMEYALNWIEQIRSIAGIPKTDTIYILESDNKWNYFLYKDTLIMANIYYPEGLKEDSAVYTVTMLSSNPQTSGDIKITAIKKSDNEKYLAKEIMTWLNSPCVITEMVDISNLEVIRFLQQYKESTFKTGRYQFYVKRDDDFSFSFNIYAKDLKLSNQLKIYVEMDLLKTVMPKNSRDVLIYDKTGKMTKYQISKCKKAFMDFIQGECQELKANNFFALELVKQAIQPVEQDWGRFVCVPFSCKETGFAEISVDDFPVFDKKPYFMVTLNDAKDRKTAVLDFFEPKYKTMGIYKNGHNKYNFWKLNNDEIAKLMNFLNSPCRKDLQEFYKAETGWQCLISAYNKNTGEPYEEEVPLDTPMPDYTKLSIVQKTGAES